MTSDKRKSPYSSIGKSIGGLMAERIVNLNRKDAVIIDNCPNVISDRRKAAPDYNYTGPKRRKTDEKSTE